MSQAIVYTGTKAEKDAKALQDCLDYLDRPEYRQKVLEFIVQVMQSNQRPRLKLKEIRIGLSFFVGIEGYPVKPLIRYAMMQTATKH